MLELNELPQELLKLLADISPDLLEGGSGILNQTRL
jgi:hypothetical protein